ncbi:MAG: hypothetical protein ACRDS0_14735 [Pseudonocardiaceae bacterium]
MLTDAGTAADDNDAVTHEPIHAAAEQGSDTQGPPAPPGHAASPVTGSNTPPRCKD